VSEVLNFLHHTWPLTNFL